MLSPQTPGHEQRLKGTRSGSLWLSPQSSKKANDYANALYKTELCRSFNDAGYCRYGLKCRFAHGMEDLRPVSRHKKYKTEPCKNYSRDGVCPYGNRCRFVHEDDPPEMLARARSASFSSPGSVSPSPSSSLTDLGRGDYEGKQNGLAHDSYPSRHNRARSVSFHSLYSTTPSLSEKDTEKDTEKIKPQDKDYDFSYSARMGGQPPQTNLLSGKSVEPFVTDVLPTSYRYIEEHSPPASVSVSVSGISSLHSASPSISQSSLKSSQMQPPLSSPSSPPTISSLPIAAPSTRQVFQPTPFKSVVGFAPSQSTSLVRASHSSGSGWNPIESGSMDLSRSLVEKDSSARELVASVSSLSLILAKSPPKLSPPSAWSQPLSSIPIGSVPTSDSLPKSSLSLKIQESKAKDIFLTPTLLSQKSTDSTDSGPVLINPLDSPPAGGPLPSPSVPDLSLDLFETGPSNRLPIFTSLTLSPKKAKA